MTVQKTVYIQYFLLLVLLSVTIDSAYSQDSSSIFVPLKNDSTELADKRKQRLDDFIGIEKKSAERKHNSSRLKTDSVISDPMLPESPGGMFIDSFTKAKYQGALQEYYTYHISGLQHRKEVFKWQLLSSKIIFVVVILLVFAGICFAAIQFYVGIKQAKSNIKEADTRTEFSASMKGIKVSSPVLGIIILVISLAFFYLYLVYVFPIEDIF